jgi:DnaJ family protein C protein 19
VKLLILLVLAVIFWFMLTGRWPWQSAAGSARKAAEQHARNLLGVASNASREDIIEAHRRLVAMVHPDRGGTSEQVHEANAARDLLLARLPGQ